MLTTRQGYLLAPGCLARANDLIITNSKNSITALMNV